MASLKIFRRGGSAMSGILNVLGMAVAFAAFYIILVQVDYDLNFNKGIKDSEKVFVMTSGSGLNLLNRPICVSTGGKGADKEVIQPQVLLRLPCYDFTPVADSTVDGN